MWIKRALLVGDIDFPRTPDGKCLVPTTCTRQSPISNRGSDVGEMKASCPDLRRKSDTVRQASAIGALLGFGEVPDFVTYSAIYETLEAAYLVGGRLEDGLAVLKQRFGQDLTKADVFERMHAAEAAGSWGRSPARGPRPI